MDALMLFPNVEQGEHPADDNLEEPIFDLTIPERIPCKDKFLVIDWDDPINE